VKDSYIHFEDVIYKDPKYKSNLEIVVKGDLTHKIDPEMIEKLKTMLARAK
jgi:hypothetical protein|tara:strand:+ start:461 stop:613 length:153 start_codon:yes stop_codon:yes gene_type:complete